MNPDHAHELERLVRILDARRGIARCNLTHAGVSDDAAARLIASGAARWEPNDTDPDNPDVDTLVWTEGHP